ncbi:MAG: GNAT family N-acetyltransferase, partial [Casimicrobiaceae bacterium]
MSATTIRPATPSDASAIAQVRVNAWRTTYRGLIPDGYLAAMKVEDSAALWSKVLNAAPNTTNTFVAEIDGAVVGFASGLMLAEPRHGLDAELSA